ncbi:hypothetical protein MJT46_018237 [Ovis ammon polii x Ovis aries]|nr:hypothetical protein MJT46_018237 [Ovis ammon polii x Ovis aries]
MGLEELRDFREHFPYGNGISQCPAMTQPGEVVVMDEYQAWRRGHDPQVTLTIEAIFCCPQCGPPHVGRVGSPAQSPSLHKPSLAPRGCGRDTVVKVIAPDGLLQEDPCTKPVHHNHRSPRALELVLWDKRSRHEEKPVLLKQSSRRSPQLEKAHAQR